MTSPLDGVDETTLIDWCRQGEFEERLTAVSQAIHPFAPQGEGNSVVFSGQARAILAAAQNPAAILGNFANSIRPNGWSGSLADIIVGTTVGPSKRYFWTIDLMFAMRHRISSNESTIASASNGNKSETASVNATSGSSNRVPTNASTRKPPPDYVPCAVERHRPSAGANPARQTVAPAGSNRSG